MKNLVSFGSDNHSGVHPALLEEMVRVNTGYAASYEQDPWSQDTKKAILTAFNAVDCALVFNGTAANVIALQLAAQSYHSFLVSDVSHLNIDECGAPEKWVGCKLIPVKSTNGKIKVEDLKAHLIRRGDQHFSQVRGVSITQPTEYGTLYEPQEISQIKSFCDEHGLVLHIDGARLANAAVQLNLSFAELTKEADLISFGGAKNGLMLGEYVIVRNPELKEGLKFFRKQSLQLPAKTRFLTAPFGKYLSNGLWLEIAQHENRLAQKLREGLEAIPHIEITQPTQANSVFCILPQEMIKTLRKEFFFYIWNEKTFEVRLMTSFATTDQEVEAFVDRLKQLFAEKG